MSSPPSISLTEVLNQWADGDEGAGQEALSLAYDRLREIAHAHLRRERRNPVLQTTSIVHEAYLKLAQQSDLSWRSREHFFAFAARVMRRLLVDQARDRNRHKRGGLALHVPLDDLAEDRPRTGGEVAASLQVLDVHRALEDLESVDPSKARLVEMRFFGGLTMDETAAVLEISPATAYRQWSLAKAWLYQHLTS